MFDLYSNTTLQLQKQFLNLLSTKFQISSKLVIRSINPIWSYYKKKMIYKKNTYITIQKPKKQFYSTIKISRIFSYSTGLIIKALNHESRSIRRTKLGYIVFFSFLLKQLNLRKSKQPIISVIKTLNNYNLLKSYLYKYLSNITTSQTILIKLSKNYSYHNYKKISYITKRMRVKYKVE
jgi:hypothetical protein